MNKFGNYLLIAIVFVTLSFCSVSKMTVFSNGTSKLIETSVDIPVLKLRSGDIVLRDGKSFISQVFRNFSMTDKRYSHAGIVYISNGRTYVCHVVAAEGKRSNKIRLEPISSFCNPTDNTAFAIYRSSINTNVVDSVLIEYFKKRVSFDNDFDLKSDDKMYCTELVYKVLTAANRNEKFINLSHESGVDYVACDNLYLNPKTKLIYSHIY